MPSSAARPSRGRVSEYFFKQVAWRPNLSGQLEDAEARVEQARPVDAAPVDPEQLPSLQAVSDDRAESLPHVVPSDTRLSLQPPAPFTHNRSVDNALWRSFTPEAYKEDLVAFSAAEHRQTCDLASQMEAAWRHVEAVLARNARRREILDGDYQAKLSDVDRIRFWDSEAIEKRYGLDVSIRDSGQSSEGRAAGEAAMASNEFGAVAASARITMSFDVAPVDSGRATEETDADSVLPTEPLSGDGSCEDDSATRMGPMCGEGEVPAAEEPNATSAAVTSTATAEKLGMHNTKAWRFSREELLDPMRRPNCLRRLFAPLLQRREKLPKHLTLLLTDVQTVQSTYLKEMERSLQHGRLFRIPLHLPFQIIATYISRYLTQDSGTLLLEASQGEAFGLQKTSVERLREFVMNAASHASNKDMVPQERYEMAKRMWDLLFFELDSHQAAHEEVAAAYQRMTDSSTASQFSMRCALKACDEASQHAVGRMQRDAEECTNAVKKSTERIFSVLDEMDSTYNTDLEALEQSIQARSYAAARSEAHQEKLVRRVREAVKELHAEQRRYEEVSRELMMDRLAKAQLQASYGQLQYALQTHNEVARDAERRTAEMRATLEMAEEARRTLIDACTRHIERAKVDDFYRRSRIAIQCARNAQQWRRCLNDVGYLYDERFTRLEGRTHTSWQLNYLLAGEREWATRNALDVKEEFRHLDDKWADVMRILQEVEMVMPKVEGKDVEAEERQRQAMRVLDDMRQVQRQTTTLRAHRAEKGKTASGNGATAALYIGEVGASTTDGAADEAAAQPLPCGDESS